MALHAVHLGATSFCRYLEEALRPLARLPASSTAPYLSAYFNWLPAGEHPSKPPALTTFEHEAKRLVERLSPRGAAFESVSADTERIQSYLAGVSNIVPIALEEEFVRLAIQTDADIVFVRAFADADIRSEPAEVLDKLGGVGAILKFVP